MKDIKQLRREQHNVKQDLANGKPVKATSLMGSLGIEVHRM